MNHHSSRKRDAHSPKRVTSCDENSTCDVAALLDGLLRAEFHRQMLRTELTGLHRLLNTSAHARLMLLTIPRLRRALLRALDKIP